MGALINILLSVLMSLLSEPQADHQETAHQDHIKDSIEIYEHLKHRQQMLEAY
ncbi:hypothetical protein [Christiangramia salexigens]|uniref:hypothetical protein n=1 Tax=Christiangramia salexigens TaxID=1913577 RepID=UPI0012EB1FDA|nr:hypothetical protein [Christiangramia salexigens]